MLTQPLALSTEKLINFFKRKLSKGLRSASQCQEESDCLLILCFCYCNKKWLLKTVAILPLKVSTLTCGKHLLDPISAHEPWFAYHEAKRLRLHRLKSSKIKYLKEKGNQ